MAGKKRAAKLAAPVADVGLALDLGSGPTRADAAKAAKREERLARLAEEESQLPEVAKAFRERKRAEKDRFTQTVDSEHWFCVCFDSRAQKEAFLLALKWSQAVEADKYLDGVALADKIGVTLPEAVTRPLREGPFGFEDVSLEI